MGESLTMKGYYKDKALDKLHACKFANALWQVDTYTVFFIRITLILFIRNQFIRNEISGGRNFKKLESWDKGNLRNFVYIRFHEIQEITCFILYKKAYSVKMFNLKKLVRNFESSIGMILRNFESRRGHEVSSKKK